MLVAGCALPEWFNVQLFQQLRVRIPILSCFSLVLVLVVPIHCCTAVLVTTVAIVPILPMHITPTHVLPTSLVLLVAALNVVLVVPVPIVLVVLRVLVTGTHRVAVVGVVVAAFRVIVPVTAVREW